MGSILLIRHAESTWNKTGQIQGTSDPPLSARGRAQARALARALAGERFRRIETSRLARARETARILAKKLGRRPTIKRDLHEIHLGAWEGLRPAEVDRLYRKGYAKWLACPTAVEIPRAEPIPAFQRRILTCWKRYASFAKRSPHTLAVVTHGGFITAVLAHLLDASFSRLLTSLPLGNAACARVTWHVNRWCISITSNGLP